MRFRRKIDNNIRMFFLKQLVDCSPVANICLHETEIRVIHNGRKRGQIARIRQLVKADNPIVRVLLELMEVYEVMKKNQYGQYLKDVMDGKYQERLY